MGKLLRAGFAAFVVAIVLALYPYTAYPSGPIKQLILHWAALLLGSAWILGTLLAKEPVRKPPVFFELLVIFLLFNVVASLLSSHVSNSMVHVRTLLSCLVLYLVASHVYRTPGQFRRPLIVTCAAVACSTAYAFCQRYGLDPFPWADRSAVEYKELPGTFGNPNYAAHTLILCIIISGYLAWNRRSFWCAGFTILFVVHMYFAHQRGGLVGLAAAAGLCLLAVIVRKVTKHPARTVAATLTIFLLLGIVGAGGIMTLTKIRTGSAFPVDESLMLRYHSFYSAARMAKERPLFGFGPGNYEIQNASYWTDYERRWFAEQRMMNSHVHNDVLETAIDAGLPAAGLYLGILLAGIVFGLAMGCSEDAERRRLGFMFAAFFCAYLVDGLFGFNSRVPVSGVLLFIVAGGMEGIRQSGEAQRETNGVPVSRTPAWRALAWRAAVLLVSVAIVFVETRTFMGELTRYRGRAYTMGNSFQAAAYSFARGGRLMPWDWLYPLEEGRVYQRQNNLEAALACFERSIALNPNYLPTVVAVAHAKFEQGLRILEETSTQEASQAKEAGQKTTPLQRETAKRAAELLEAADAHAQQALTLCPMLPEAHDILGRSASVRASLLPKLEQVDHSDEAVQECWRTAEEHLSQAARYGARNPARVNTMLAEARATLGDLDGAEDAYVHALQAEPSLKETWQRFYRFAQTNKRVDTVRGRLEEGIHEMEVEARRDADAVASMYMWRALLEGELYENPEGAVAAFRQALRYAPNREDIWSAFALFVGEAKKRAALENTVMEVTRRLANESKSPIPAVAAVAAVLQGGAESLEKTSSLLLDTVNKIPDDADRKPVVAVGWAAEIVFTAVQKAGSSFPGWETAVMNLGRVMMRMKAYDAAQYLLGSAMPRLSADQKTECAQLRARMLVEQKRYEDAIQVLQAASAQGAKREPLHLELARTLAKAGKNHEARQVYQSILKSGRLTGDGRRIVQQEYDALPK